MLGSTDVPTENVEHDLFHINTYIDGLSTFIKECATPMTVSIQGDWGSGKTSMMNMICKKISDEVYPIWFNTWQFSQFDMGDNLVFSMMEMLLDKLGCEEKMITKVMNGIAGFARKTVTIVTDHVIGGEAANEVSEFMKPDKPVNSAREIDKLKEKFQNAINEKIKAENKNRVVVFVDDLDRLQPGKAVELLEVLKLFLECQQCVFVIAVDYDVVTRGIRQKYGLDVSEEKGKSFFDKIIQLPFKVPIAQYDIKNYVSEMLSNMNMATADDDIELYVHLIHSSIGLNPRSIKRLFNTYQLLDIITCSSVPTIGETERRRILFSIICMQMGYEKLYSYFASTRIDSDLIEQLDSSDTIDDCLKDILDDDNTEETDSKELNKLKKFIPYFCTSIKNGENITETELYNLQSVLKCSSVISVSNTAEADDSIEWDYRYKNKMLIEQINQKLSDLGQLKRWMPKKPREGVKLSDASAYIMFTAKEGFDFSLEYYLSRTPNGEIDTYIMLYCKTSHKQALFFNTFGPDPLDLGITPETEKWGRIMYCKVITVNDNNAVEKVSELYRRVYAEVQKYL